MIFEIDKQMGRVNRHIVSYRALGGLRVKTISLLLLLLLGKLAVAAGPTDTLAMAKEKANHYKYNAAKKLLKAYCPNHPKDFNALWLYAHTCYLTKDFKKAAAVYEEALKLQPKNYNLILDYAQTLIAQAKYNRIKELLAPYLVDGKHKDAELLQAKIDFWQGEYQPSLKSTKAILAEQPKNNDANDLLTNLLIAQSPWLKVGAELSVDNQPLTYVTPSAEAGVYFSKYSALHFSVKSPIFVKDGQTYTDQWVQADNTFQLSHKTLNINIGAGLVRLAANNTLSWSGNLSISKTYLQHLVLGAELQHLPYYYTRNSLNTPVMQYRYGASLVWDDWNDWNGALTFKVDHFADDKNFVYTGNTWFFAPPIKASVFQFRFGYGYSFSTSKDNKFTADKTLSQIVNDYATTTVINGTYNPYFTPRNQSVHTAKVAINIHPASILDINVNANVGLHGTADNPYLYLGKDSTTGATIIATNYSNINFIPIDAGVSFNFHLSDKASLMAEYGYHRTFYYDSHYVGLGFKMSFWNGKKK